MPVNISHEDILFIRQLERKLEKAKYDNAERLKTETIKALYDFAKPDAGLDSDISKAYKKLRTTEDEHEKKDARAVIDRHIKWRTGKNLEEQHNYAIDRVVLGLANDEQLPQNAFADIWKTLQDEYQLGGTAPTHHTDMLDRIKYAFTIKKGTKSAQALHDEYHAARTRYFQLLRVKHEEKKLWTKPVKNKLHYELGYESQQIKNDIANKKEDQKLLTHGLFWAKVFATAQAFFISGGTWATLTLWGLTSGFGLFLSIPLVCALFLNVSRSNWITINEEMGPLLKVLFFDPALSHLSYAKRFWYMIRRVNIFDGVNTLKGASNLVAGLSLGILTFAGGVTLLGLIPAAPYMGTFSLGVFGTGSILVIALAAILAAVTSFVYFVINNYRQQQLNKNPKAIDEANAELEKLRTITATSKMNPFKRYGFNITVGMIGVAGMLFGAAPDLVALLSPYLGGTTNIFGALHASFVALPWVFAITVGLVAMACYGISSFYRFRTINSTKRMIAGDSGLTFDNLSGTKLDNLDVTGRDAPDFAAESAPDFLENPKHFGHKVAKFFYNIGTYFFNMDPNRDNSKYVRFGNAMGQGMPAFKGAGFMGVSGIVMTAAFKAYGPGMVASGAAAPIILAVSMTIGVLAGVFAFWASYSANSTKLRVVNETITATEVLKRDQKAMGHSFEPEPELEFSNNFGGWVARNIYEATGSADREEWVRMGHSIDQGKPFHKGLGVAAIAAYAMDFGFGATAGYPIILGVSLALGLIAGTFALCRAHFAVCAKQAEDADLDSKAGVDKQPSIGIAGSRTLEQTVYFHLGEDKAKTELYAQSRERHGDEYWGSGYFWGTPGFSKDDKLGGARSMVTKMDAWVDGTETPDVRTEDKINYTSVEDIDNRTTSRLNFLYGTPNGTVSGRNPLSQGELGDIAHDVDYLIGGKAVDVYHYAKGSEENKMAEMESVRRRVTG